MPSYDHPYLDQPLKYLKGVGENRARIFARLGIHTVGDIINYFPRDYEDRSRFISISEAKDGETASIKVRFASAIAESRPRRNLSILKATVTDGLSYMSVVWFNQGYLKQSIDPSREYVFFGTVKRSGTWVEMHNPVAELSENTGNLTGCIVPVYPLTKGITQNILRKIIRNALNGLGGRIEDMLPPTLRRDFKLAEASYCYEQIHFPSNAQSVETARRRLVFEELLLLQLGLAEIKGSNSGQPGLRFDDTDVDPLLRTLPFKLTQAQQRVFNEIADDLKSGKRMNRLIQGDVGSGKTIVAVLAIYAAWRSGYQSVFMVPTEILAEQHYAGVAPLLGRFGIEVALLTGGTKKKEKERIRKEAEEGSIHLVIGTHAVLEDYIRFRKLGLVVTDEQHRFGVRQRAVISNKGDNPNLLVMTATPIPRTLTLALYGDLDVSIIDELPPGRKPIETYSVDEGKRERVYNFIRKKVAAGRQAYIVCPLVEESESIEAESATGLAERIRDDILKGLRVGLIHGKMKSSEKDDIMRSFAAGNTDVLVSTTVVEVGVNVPNACLMVVENAERFGLAQLHQLRGRVGRGEHQSYCILFNQSRSQIAARRMEIMTSTNDGFVIAEKDLELRGPGDVFGVRQHGLPEFRIANLYRDMDVLKDVQAASKRISAENLLNGDEEYARLGARVKKVFGEMYESLSMN
jgi:ATP-dependent DNA helicase RecG